MSHSAATMPTSDYNPLPAQRLLGKVVLITGAGGAIGVEAAARLLREGARLALVDISAAALDMAMTVLAALVPSDDTPAQHLLPICADVTDERQVEEYTASAVKTFGRLDCAFLNAGISYTSTSILETTVEKYEEVMRTNVRSAFLGIKHAAKAMKDLGNGGSIIVTSSIAGLRGTPGLCLYSASKFALRGLCLTAAAELGCHGIRVNTLHPSGVDSPMFRAAWNPEKIAELLKGMPLGRFAHVSDISGVVAFLTSDDSKFMTGGFLKVDGGCISI